MDAGKLTQLFEKIDEVNAKDPNTEVHEGKEIPKELLYGHRMTEMLECYWPDASPELRIAVRAQHIARFEVPRTSFPEGRTGYLKWRTHLYCFHADRIAELMRSLDFPEEQIERVRFLVQKKDMLRDPESSVLEGVACLVFLKYYYSDFIKNYSDEKVLDIVQKTWKRMNEKARRIAQNDIHLEGRGGELLKAALS